MPSAMFTHNDNFAGSYIVTPEKYVGASDAPARIGSPSPFDPSQEQYVTTRQETFWDTLVKSEKGVLKALSNPTQAAKDVSGKVANGVKFEAAKIRGEIGKIYYGAQTSVFNAIGGTAKTVEKVATGFKWGSMAIVAVIAIVLIAQFRLAVRGK